jgi:hypothetical protein
MALYLNLSPKNMSLTAHLRMLLLPTFSVSQKLSSQASPLPNARHNLLSTKSQLPEYQNTKIVSELLHLYLLEPTQLFLMVALLSKLGQVDPVRL